MKWMKVIREDIRVCDVNGKMVKERKRWGENGISGSELYGIKSEDKELNTFYIRKKCELIKQN